MKQCFLIFSFLFFSAAAFTQNLTGVWQGYFYSGIGLYKQYYKYEVQINNLTNNSLQGVTYSYRTTVFYGKATMQGIWFPKTKNILLKELNLIELKMEGGSEACSMTCNLNYSKNGSTEMLQGGFTSINVTTKKDCGSGTVYLEKVPVSKSDFGPETFLLKKKPVVKSVDTVAQKKPAVKPPAANNNAAKKPATQASAANKNTAPPKVVTQKPVAPIKNDSIVKVDKPDIKPSQQTKVPDKKFVPIPDIIKSRSNPLVKTIITNSPDIEVQLFDNGEIDGDTITVYRYISYAWKPASHPGFSVVLKIRLRAAEPRLPISI